MSRIIPIKPVPSVATMPTRDTDRLARLGDWMTTHRSAILLLQWLIVIAYIVLVTLPAFLPQPHPEARLLANDMGPASWIDPIPCGDATATPQPLGQKTTCWQDRAVLLAQYLFWGVWWPFVIVATMLFGRVWCGVLCPEGTLTEFASRHGRGGAIPRWLRWGGWPLVAFLGTTIYGQLISVYDYAQAALLILGGSTLAAMLVGYLYGRGKRVWCRYLCPVSGVFALLARLSPLHFHVDRTTWNAQPRRAAAVDCPTLLDVSRLDGNAQCHACGRCSGHRQAVSLALRSPNAEILATRSPRTSEALLLVFGLLGAALGAFQWSLSPWFIQARQAVIDELLAQDITWPLTQSPAWWLLTAHPESNDVFTWLDGIVILSYIGSFALLVGGLVFVALKLAAGFARIDWRRLTLSLAPLAGISLFLGLSMMSINHLRGEGVLIPALPGLRALLVLVGVVWSAWLGLQQLRAGESTIHRQAVALMLLCIPLGLVTTNWLLVFHVWQGR